MCEIIRFSPLQYLNLNIRKPSESKIMIDAQTLQNLFLAISEKQLDYIRIILRPTLDVTTSGEQLEQLQSSFKQLLESLSPDLYDFYLYLDFREEG